MVVADGGRRGVGDSAGVARGGRVNGFSAAANRRLLVAAAVAAVAVSLFADDWLPAAAIGVLWIVWRILPDGFGPPILSIAMSYQWGQVTAGMLYAVITGRTLIPMQQIDYRPIVTMSLVSLLAIAAGLFVGRWVVTRRRTDSVVRPNLAFVWPSLLLIYGVMTVAEGASRGVAFSYPSLTQPILALTTVRLIVLYVLFRRLASPDFQWAKLAALVLFELVLNSTGYFANFREPMILAIIAVAEVFDWNSRKHAAAVVVLAVALASASVVWMSVRSRFREEIDTRESFGRAARLDMLAALAGDWWNDADRVRVDDIDFLVERVWAVYYPALALQRVPGTIPHANGELLRAAVLHTIQPRIFFPDKPELASDSELVRKYSGVHVAGREQNTSIAFGYVPEAYVDFGVPVMFVPMVAFGFVMGAVYGLFHRILRYAEFRIPTTVVVFWLGLYLYERSWANMMGFSFTLFVYVGALAVLMDRLLLIRFEAPGAAASMPRHVIADPVA
jgi:hypothetical protein